MRGELDVITHTYNFLLWLLPHIALFPRQHRFTLGDRMESKALEILERLVEASYSSEKRALLHQTNLSLEQLRYLIRLAKDLKLLTGKQYEFATNALYTIGREIGGWAKQQQG